MAYREVTMLEVKEVLRLWLDGVPKSAAHRHGSPFGRNQIGTRRSGKLGSRISNS